MAKIMNAQNWVLPFEIIEAASRQAAIQRLPCVYLSNGAKKHDDFLFYKDMDRTEVAFVIDKRDL